LARIKPKICKNKKGNEVEERKTFFFPKDGPTIVRVGRSVSYKITLKSTLVFVDTDVSVSQLHATSSFVVVAPFTSGPCHVARTHSASNCKIHSEA
jgi:hypothetical protein